MEAKTNVFSSSMLFMKHPTIIHIAVETFCLLLIFMYIRRNTKRLQNQIDDLTRIIQEQQEIIHLHQKQLSRFVQSPQFIANTSKPTPNIVQVPVSSHEFDNVGSMSGTTYFTIPYTESDSGHDIDKENEGRVTTIIGTTTTTESLDEELKEEINELVREEQRQQTPPPSITEDELDQETDNSEKVDVVIEVESPPSPKNTELFENLPS